LFSTGSCFSALVVFAPIVFCRFERRLLPVSAEDRAPEVGLLALHRPAVDSEQVRDLGRGFASG
jgi:hypothetical protein